MDQLRFTIPEILSLIGVTQCVYVLVYMMLHAGKFARAFVPMAYFLVLGLAFLFDFAQDYLGSAIEHYYILQWAAWFCGPPLSVLLIIQIAQITKVPAPGHYWVLLLPPAAFFSAQFMADESVSPLREWLIITGLISGAVSLLAIWFNKSLFKTLLAQTGGRERYWLILSLVFLNVFFLGIMLLSVTEAISLGKDSVLSARTILGLSFVYLAGTSLFRIYPKAVSMKTGTGGQGDLNDQEIELALKIERLLNLEKVYQEPAYARADLARECDVSEALISKVINEYFRKSFPQIMNEHRVEDAKRLLVQTEAPVKVIAEETGFNALPSFNRVFKDITGESPSGYRKKRKS